MKLFVEMRGGRRGGSRGRWGRRVKMGRRGVSKKSGMFV